MAEWNSPCGEIKKYIASEDELWSLTNYFFSDACKKQVHKNSASLKL